MSEDTTDNTTKGSYTISSALTNNYINSEATTYASNTTGTIANKQFTHKATASGQNAKTAKQVETLLMSKEMVAGTLEMFVRFKEDMFKDN